MTNLKKVIYQEDGNTVLVFDMIVAEDVVIISEETDPIETADSQETIGIQIRTYNSGRKRKLNIFIGDTYTDVKVKLFQFDIEDQTEEYLQPYLEAATYMAKLYDSSRYIHQIDEFSEDKISFSFYHKERSDAPSTTIVVSK